MTLQQLQYVLAAFEHGSFSAAADALHLAQPSLSEQVRRLEAELGVALFPRVGRGLVATEAGRALRPHAETRHSAIPRRRSDGVARATLGALVEARARVGPEAVREHLEEPEGGDGGGEEEHDDMIGVCILQR